MNSFQGRASETDVKLQQRYYSNLKDVSFLRFLVDMRGIDSQDASLLFVKASSEPQTSSRSFTRALALAFNEWLLILMLLINSIFSYVITRFAYHSELQSPCLMCSQQQIPQAIGLLPFWVKSLVFDKEDALFLPLLRWELRQLFRAYVISTASLSHIKDLGSILN
ncbi:Uncharacterized protein Rs2_42678 [Raphanus sativus]|nr:Uncharacterized protein Rs2_42678 [Raphanus sativus]